MSLSEQVLHDSINLSRLVRRLKKSILYENNWQSDSPDIWITAKSTLQKIKYARELLLTVEQDDPQFSTNKAQSIRNSLDQVESRVRVLDQKQLPQRGPSLLSQLPLPETETAKPPLQLAEDTLLLSPSETSFPSAAVILPPISSPPATNTTPAIPPLLNASNTTHQELSDQLAQMATQLKRNAQHFADSLAKDQAVVDDAQVKLESNYDVMLKERVRLRDHSSKSGSTTCLVFASVVGVAGVSVFMIMLMRIV